MKKLILNVGITAFWFITAVQELMLITVVINDIRSKCGIFDRLMAKY